MKLKYGGVWIGALLAAPALAQADKAGEELLQKCVQTESKAQSLRADITIESTVNGRSGTAHGTLLLKKPNLAHVVMTGADARKVTIHSDGKKLITYLNAENQFQSEAADLGGGNVARQTRSAEVAIFFNPDTLSRFRAMGTGAKINGSAVIGGVTCKVLQIVGGQGTLKIYVGPDALVRGVGMTGLESRLTNVKIDAPLQAAFAWTLPKGATPTTGQAAMESDGGNSGGGGTPASSLLAVGKVAPDFALPLAGGGTVKLSAVTKAHKATLLNFWSYF